MLTLRRKVVYVVFALMAVGMLIGAPASTVFAGCSTTNNTTCD